MSVTFEQLLAQARVELDSKGLYLAKEHRTCEAMARVFVAVRAAIDNHAQDLFKAEAEKASLSKANSKLAASLADAEREKAAMTKSAFRRGLESLPELPQATRDRLLNVNGE